MPSVAAAWATWIMGFALLCLVLGAGLPSIEVRLDPPSAYQSNWVVDVVDADYAGRTNALALDTNNSPHIAYVSSTGGGQPLWIKYATKVNGSWQIQTLEGINITEGGPSIDVDSLNRPWIAYPRGNPANTKHDLRLAHWNGAAWEFQTVEPLGVEAGWWPSLVLDRGDNPHIAYYSNVTGNLILTYAKWDGASWRYQTVFASQEISPSNLPTWHCISLKLDSLDRPNIAEAGNATLTYFRWDGTRWEAQFPDLSTNINSVVSLAFDSADQPHIAYDDVTAQDVRYVRWNGSRWVQEIPVSTGYVGWGVSLALDANDGAHISYAHGNVGGDVLPRYLYYTLKAPAGTWLLPETADPSERVGETSLSLDSHGLPHISYYLGYPLAGSELRYAYVPWVDNSPPTSKVLPVSRYWNGNPVTAEAMDESGVANVTLWYRFSSDNASWGSWGSSGTLSSTPWQWSFAYPSGEGFYELQTTAIDMAGNAEPPPPFADAIAGYDVTPPASSALALASYWYASVPIVVNATAVDAPSGIAEVTLRSAHSVDNATWGAWSDVGTLTAWPWSWFFPFPDGEGHYRFHAIAQDVAGNAEQGKTVAEAVAGYRILPDYIPSSASPSSIIVAGLSTPITFAVQVANVGGNANASATLAFANATMLASPFATVSVPPLSAGGIVGPFTAAWVSPGAPGTYEVIATVDSESSVQETDESNNAYVWTIAVVSGPLTSLVLGSPNVTAAQTFVTSATDLSFSVLDQGGSGIRSTWYRLDNGAWTNYSAAGPFRLSGEWAHFLEWYSEDFAGNVEAVQSAVVLVDDTPPITTPSVGDPKYLVGGTFVTSSTPFSLAAVDGGVDPVGLSSTEYRIDMGPWIPYATPFSVAGEGAHGMAFRSNDQLGNAEVPSILPVTVDDSPPTVSLAVGNPQFASAQLYVRSTSPLTISASDGGVVPVGLSSVEYRSGGGAWTQFANPFYLSPPDGTMRVEYAATDQLGHLTTDARDLVVDDTPPNTSLSPAAGPYAPDTLFTLAAADGGSGLLRTEYRVDDGTWTTYRAGFSLPVGDHVIRYRSVDRLNNTEAQHEFQLTVAIPPTGQTPEPNWKPLVAATFALLLAIAGGWASSKRPWKGGAGRTAVLRAFAFTSLPFVIAEAATGVVSLATGLLSIPPILGAGIAVDGGLLAAGVAASLLRARREHAVHERDSGARR